MDRKMKATVHKRDRMRWRQKPVQGRRKYEATVILEKKQSASVFWSLTLPEGRLQLSNAVSTRFLSAENILKIL